MKTKLVALLMVILMVAAMATACGNPAEEQPEQSPQATDQEQQPEDEQPTEQPQEMEKVTFRLNYLATGLHAPYYVALEKGYYEEVGLDVTIAEGTGSGTTAKLVGMGTDLIGQSDFASVAAAVTQGIPVRVVCPIYKFNGFSIITLEENGIDSPKDLEGKDVGIATGDGPSKLWEGVVKANDIDETKVNYVTMGAESKVGALVTGQVDAILAGADNDALQVTAKGGNVKVLRYADFGVPTVGLSLIASNDAIENNTETIRKFIAASLKGWDDARKDPDGAVAIFQQYIPNVDTDLARGGLDAALASLFTESSATISDVSSEEWEVSVQLLRDYMELDDSFPADTLYTTVCMPEELPAK